jgi:hypothetical protein
MLVGGLDASHVHLQQAASRLINRLACGSTRETVHSSFATKDVFVRCFNLLHCEHNLVYNTLEFPEVTAQRFHTPTNLFQSLTLLVDLGFQRFSIGFLSQQNPELVHVSVLPDLNDPMIKCMQGLLEESVNFGARFVNLLLNFRFEAGNVGQHFLHLFKRNLFLKPLVQILFCAHLPVDALLKYINRVINFLQLPTKHIGRTLQLFDHWICSTLKLGCKLRAPRGIDL